MSAYIFLDFDGVLNGDVWLDRFAYHEQSEHIDPACVARINRIIEATGASEHIDPTCVARINRIIEATGAKVIVSSAWRIVYKPDELQAMLEKRGFVGQVIAVTGRAATREMEIMVAASAFNEDTRWIAIDDLDLSDLGDNFLRTNGSVGITDADVDTAIRMLWRSP